MHVYHCINRDIKEWLHITAHDLFGVHLSFITIYLVGVDVDVSMLKQSNLIFLRGIAVFCVARLVWMLYNLLRQKSAQRSGSAL